MSALPLILLLGILHQSPNENGRSVSQLDVHLRTEAAAFVVGWHSRIVLLPETRHKRALIAAIGAYMDALGVHLEHEADYYLTDLEKDGGLRAQEFAEQTYQQLSARDLGIANHFGIAINVLLTIAHCACERNAPSSVREELSQLTKHLDIPRSLQKPPPRHLVNWALHIERYFESLLRHSESKEIRILGIWEIWVLHPVRFATARRDSGVRNKPLS